MEIQYRLDVKIVESILEAYANEATILKLLYIARISYHTLKKYLFYLIEYDCISYHGEERVYNIRYEGWKLLSEIKTVKKIMTANEDNNDYYITIVFES
jgi:predicted transcriptional regulator